MLKSLEINVINNKKFSVFQYRDQHWQEEIIYVMRLDLDTGHDNIDVRTSVHGCQSLVHIQSNVSLSTEKNYVIFNIMTTCFSLICFMFGLAGTSPLSG